MRQRQGQQQRFRRMEQEQRYGAEHERQATAQERRDRDRHHAQLRAAYLVGDEIDSQAGEDRRAAEADGRPQEAKAGGKRDDDQAQSDRCRGHHQHGIGDAPRMFAGLLAEMRGQQPLDGQAVGDEAVCETQQVLTVDFATRKARENGDCNEIEGCGRYSRNQIDRRKQALHPDTPGTQLGFSTGKPLCPRLSQERRHGPDLSDITGGDHMEQRQYSPFACALSAPPHGWPNTKPRHY